MAAKSQVVEAAEVTSVSVSENVVTVTINDRPFSLAPDVLHNLRRQIDAAYIETH